MISGNNVLVRKGRDRCSGISVSQVCDLLDRNPLKSSSSWPAVNMSRVKRDAYDSFFEPYKPAAISLSSPSLKIVGEPFVLGVKLHRAQLRPFLP
jgi:hypothetical protein